MQFFLRPDVDSAASGRKKDCVGMLFTTHRNACNSVDSKLQSLRQETALTRQFSVDSLAAITIKPLTIAFVLYKSAETPNGVSAYSALQNIRHYGSFLAVSYKNARKSLVF